MDAFRFDQLAMVFARDVSRRTAGRRFGASLATITGVTGLWGGRALAQDATAADQRGDEEAVRRLSLQLAGLAAAGGITGSPREAVGGARRPPRSCVAPSTSTLISREGMS